MNETRKTQPKMSDLQINTLAQVGVLENDLSALGWDQPARLYFIAGEEDDPYLQMVGPPIPGSATAQIVYAHENGFRVPAGTLGLVLAQEATRHLTFEETIERNPATMVQKIAESIVRDGGVEPQGGWSQNQLEDYYYNNMVPGLPNPPDLPDLMRAQVRLISAVLLDGTQFFSTVVKDSGKPAFATVEDHTNIAESFIHSLLYQVLHGVHPGSGDPIQSVADFQTLEALSALPTVEKRTT